jgi:hypothetical protein
MMAYVQWFSKPQAPEEVINMYRVQRSFRDGKPDGDIILVDSISRFVQLIPRFGPTIGKKTLLTAQNSMDMCKDYYVNSFADKEIYQAVY